MLAEDACTGGADEEFRGVAVEEVEKSFRLLSVSEAPLGLPALIIALLAEGAGARAPPSEWVAFPVPNPTKSMFVGTGTADASVVPD